MSWSNLTKSISSFTNATKNLFIRTFLLKEDGGYLLLEDGSRIIINDQLDWTDKNKNVSSYINQTKN